MRTIRFRDHLGLDHQFVIFDFCHLDRISEKFAVPAVYVLLHCSDDVYEVLTVGQTNNFRERCFLHARARKRFKDKYPTDVLFSTRPAGQDAIADDTFRLKIYEESLKLYLAPTLDRHGGTMNEEMRIDRRSQPRQNRIVFESRHLNVPSRHAVAA